ncbi:MAG: dipeptide ABC transporter ATP-binding protein [Anaerolineae bacterium]|nr:dipeptide ABC transporter ATP-binding protein [Anaerolineae bacterium]NUQ05668.1 dipeptide ABC transporter ATP-binding protein [Anaerolineae bacterium]
MPDSNQPLLAVEDLKVHFRISKGFLFGKKVGAVRAVDGVSFAVERGETLGLVGESGCGKSTTGLGIIQMPRPTSGKVLFDGVDLMKIDSETLRRTRRHLQMVFQDPYASLNPRLTVEKIIAEPMVVHNLEQGPAVRERVRELLRLVGLDPRVITRYPHEFSGGQRQRIGIARALAANPSFIICDEPISALDVSIQAQIINLLKDLQEQFNLTYLFIAHDLAVVRHFSDRIAVMYLGRIVELANRSDLYDHPKHPYTKALLSAVPLPDPKRERQRERIILKGEVPSPIRPPKGCHFNTRCPLAKTICFEEAPEIRDVSGHQVACHLVQ